MSAGNLCGKRGRSERQVGERRQCHPPKAVITAWVTLPVWSITAIGSVAALCTTGAFVPQVIRVVRLKHAEEISLATFVAFSAGTFAWLVYGLLINSLPVVVANAATCALSVSIVLVRLKYSVPTDSSAF